MKSLLTLALAVIAVLLPAAIHAQQPGSKTYVLKAARMFDGKSNTITKPGVVVVSNGKIVGVGESAAIPAGAEVIDLGDATLLPGFIDAHTHLTMQYREDYSKALLDDLQKPIPEMAIDATVNARITLMAGFTTVRDVGSENYLDVGLRNAIDKGALRGAAGAQIRRHHYQNLRHRRSFIDGGFRGYAATHASGTRRAGGRSARVETKNGGARARRGRRKT